MPRPNPPPTPGSSSDIRGKEGQQSVPGFNLPPTAYHDHTDGASTASATPSANGSDSSYRPVSPTSPDVSRKRTASSHGPVITKDDFALPPPPTRSRKIIHMKPRDEQQQNAQPAASATSTGKTGAQGGSKKKQNNSGQTAAGRKIARKTAHSLIERRRRSKMNDEFGVLKDMIPACKGQEMHKLAILQASIEYLRYLEQCVSDLQGKHHSPHQPPQAPERGGTVAVEDDDDDDDDGDEEMADDRDADQGASTPATTGLQHSGSGVSLPSLSQITTTTTISPSMFPVGAGRHYSISSATSSYSPYFHSNQPSPAFGPQLHHVSTAPPFNHNNAFGLGSPALKPVDSASHTRQIAESAMELSETQRLASKTASSGSREQEMDHEATAALLMLNHDRRSWRAAHETDSGRSNTGMSVRDLLSG